MQAGNSSNTRDEQIVALAMAGQGPAAIARNLGITKGAVEWAIGKARASGVTFPARKTMRSGVEANANAILDDWATGKFLLAALVDKHGGSEDTVHTIIRRARAAGDPRALTLGERNAAGRRSHESEKPQPPRSFAERMGIRIGATAVMFDGSTLYKRRENRVKLSAGDEYLDAVLWHAMHKHGINACYREMFPASDLNAMPEAHYAEAA